MQVLPGQAARMSSALHCTVPSCQVEGPKHVACCAQVEALFEDTERRREVLHTVQGG